MSRKLGTRAVEVGCERRARRAHKRHEPLLRPLAKNPGKFLVKIEVAQAEPHELTHAQAAAIEHLEHSAIARARGRGRKRLLQQARRRLDRDHIGQALLLLGECHRSSRGRGRKALAQHERVQALHRRESSLDRRVGVPAIATGGHKGLDVGARHIVRRGDTSLRKKGRVRGKVAPVRGDRVGGKPALNGQVVEVGPHRLLQGTRRRDRHRAESSLTRTARRSGNTGTRSPATPGSRQFGSNARALPHRAGARPMRAGRAGAGGPRARRALALSYVCQLPQT